MDSPVVFRFRGDVMVDSLRFPNHGSILVWGI